MNRNHQFELSFAEWSKLMQDINNPPQSVRDATSTFFSEINRSIEITPYNGSFLVITDGIDHNAFLSAIEHRTVQETFNKSRSYSFLFDLVPSLFNYHQSKSFCQVITPTKSNPPSQTTSKNTKQSTFDTSLLSNFKVKKQTTYKQGPLYCSSLA